MYTGFRDLTVCLLNSGMTKCYYALENFLDNLDTEDIIPHLQEIMQFLLTTIRESPSYRVKELAVSAVAAACQCYSVCFEMNSRSSPTFVYFLWSLTANAAKKEICAYFTEILDHFKPFFNPSEDEDYIKVQTQTLGSCNTLTSRFLFYKDS